MLVYHAILGFGTWNRKRWPGNNLRGPCLYRRYHLFRSLLYPLYYLYMSLLSSPSVSGVLCVSRLYFQCLLLFCSLLYPLYYLCLYHRLHLCLVCCVVCIFSVCVISFAFHCLCSDHPIISPRGLLSLPWSTEFFLLVYLLSFFRPFFQYFRFI